jgi:Tfp pilus assembly protein PilO
MFKEKVILGVVGGVIGLALGAYGFVYRPLELELVRQKAEMQSVETRAARAHEAVVSVGKEGVRAIAATEKEALLVIDELTREGKARGVNFAAITPKPFEAASDPHFKILPVELVLESRFEDLGNFLGTFENLKRTFATAPHFRVVYDERNPGKVRAEVLAHLYFLNEHYGK